MAGLRELLGRRRQCALVLLASGTLLLVASAACVAWDLVAWRAALVRDLSSLADIIGQNSTAALAFGDSRAAEEILATLRANPRIVSAVIYTSSGQPMAAFPQGREATQVAWPVSSPDGRRFERDRLLLCRGIALEQDLVGRVCIQSSTPDLQARLRLFISMVGVVLALCALLALAVSSGPPGAVAARTAGGTEAAAGDPRTAAPSGSGGGEDLELLAELARVYVAEGPLMLEELREALERRDAAAVARAAHKLKGALGALGQRARPAAEAARRIESPARGGDVAQAAQAWPALQREVARLMPEISALASAPAIPS